MKYVIGGLFMACAFASSASAQSYSGPYVGVEGGWDNYEVAADDADLGGLLGFDSVGSFDGISGDGLVGGVFAGYHYGMDSAFVAVEGFASFSDASISTSYSDVDYSYSAKVQARESYGAAVRVGLKVNSATGVYVRGGWVNTNFKASERDSDGYRFSFDETEDAIQYGVGLETMIGPKMSLRAEYLMADYGEAGLGDGIKVDSNGFKGGVAYRF